MIRRLYSLIYYSVLFSQTVPFTITDKEKEEIKRHLQERKLPWQVIKRLEAIRLLSKGLSQTLVAKQLCVRREIIYEYRKAFDKYGLSGLLKMDKPGKETLLTEEMLKKLEIYRDTYKGKLSNKELADWLLKEYNITISIDWLAKRLSMRKIAQHTEPWK